MLRGVEKEDIEPVREWLTDPELLHVLGARPIPISNIDAEKLPELFRLREGRVLAITTRDKQLVGLIAVGNFHEFNRTAQVIVLIGNRGEWGRGFGTDALRMVTKFAFDDLNLNSLEAYIPEFNSRALKAFAKVGYQREGQLRQRLFLRGRYWDVVVASAIREGWNGGMTTDQATLEATAQATNAESAATPGTAVGVFAGQSSEPRPVPIGQPESSSAGPTA
jgi:RimJ/RimL family protein N-acetyltransferase